jgi:hypothetical protein
MPRSTASGWGETSSLEQRKGNSTKTQFTKFSQNLNMLSSGLESHSTPLISDARRNSTGDRSSRETSLSHPSCDPPRYTKTSTPIVQSRDELKVDSDIVSKASKLCQYFEMSNATRSILGSVPTHDYLGVSSDANAASMNDRLKVTFDSKVLKNVDILPERLASGSIKGVVEMNKDPKTKLDLQKCLEEVLQSYVQKLDLKDLKTQRHKETNLSGPSVNLIASADAHPDENVDISATQEHSSNSHGLRNNVDEIDDDSSLQDLSSSNKETKSTNTSSRSHSKRKSKGGKHPWK